MVPCSLYLCRARLVFAGSRFIDIIEINLPTEVMDVSTFLLGSSGNLSAPVFVGDFLWIKTGGSEIESVCLEVNCFEIN